MSAPLPDQDLAAQNLSPMIGTRAYYALAILFLVYVINFIDRQILSILMEPIRRDLALSDSELGLLSGLGFFLVYAIVGLPIARLADRMSRKKIIVICLFAWSGMTALCGLAANFSQLLLARLGVAVGEAGGGPPAHSMIADLFPHGRRSTALAIYSCGIPVGILIGLAGGGWINQNFDWRTAFIVVGLPGIVLAAVLALTVKEPARSADHHPSPKVTALFDYSIIRDLWRIRSYRRLTIATSLHAFSAYGLLQWNPTFFIRTYHLDTAHTGLYLGLISGVAGGIGTFAGGYFCDILGRRNANWYAWLPALAIAVSIPFYAVTYLVETPSWALLGLIVPSLLSNAFIGPVFGTVQSLSPIKMRATAAAFLLFFLSVIGQALGPYAIGLLSDLLRPGFGADALRLSMLSLVAFKILGVGGFIWAARDLRHDIAQSQLTVA